MTCQQRSIVRHVVVAVVNIAVMLPYVVTVVRAGETRIWLWRNAGDCEYVIRPVVLLAGVILDFLAPVIARWVNVGYYALSGVLIVLLWLSGVLGLQWIDAEVGIGMIVFVPIFAVVAVATYCLYRWSSVK